MHPSLETAAFLYLNIKSKGIKAVTDKKKRNIFIYNQNGRTRLLKEPKSRKFYQTVRRTSSAEITNRRRRYQLGWQVNYPKKMNFHMTLKSIRGERHFLSTTGSTFHAV